MSKNIFSVNDIAPITEHALKLASYDAAVARGDVPGTPEYDLKDVPMEILDLAAQIDWTPERITQFEADLRAAGVFDDRDRPARPEV